MRINLDCPFSEKDQAKALGAKWDVAHKCWYITGETDPAPFVRWLTGATSHRKTAAPRKAKQRQQALAHKQKERSTPKATTSERHDLECSCDVLPWEHCDHSMEREENETQAAMLEMLQ